MVAMRKQLAPYYRLASKPCVPQGGFRLSQRTLYPLGHVFHRDDPVLGAEQMQLLAATDALQQRPRPFVPLDLSSGIVNSFHVFFAV
ncbi:hypothetical protein V2G26_012745 [Clonostachys chloroleuca]